MDWKKGIRILTGIDMSVTESIEDGKDKTIQNLVMIQKMMHRVNPSEFKRFMTLKHSGYIRFEVDQRNRYKVDRIPLKTLRHDFDTGLHFADYDEYERVYLNNNSFYHFIETEFSDALKIVEDSREKQYSYILGKFELPIRTVRNSFQSSINLTGKVTESTQEKAFEILSRMTKMILDKEREIQKLKEEMRQAEIRSNEEFLEQEIDYVKKYITMEKRMDEQ